MTGPEELAETIVSDVRTAIKARGMSRGEVRHAFDLAIKELEWIAARELVNASIIRRKVAELIAAEREAS